MNKKMAEVKVNTEQLRKMIDESSKKAADESVKNQVSVMKMIDKKEWNKFTKAQHTMSEDTAEIKKLLIGDDEYNTVGVLTRFNNVEKTTNKVVEHKIINRTRTMWADREMTRKTIKFLNIGNITGLLTIIGMIVYLILGR